MRRSIFVNLVENRLPATIGNKAKNLRRLVEKGFSVPYTCILTDEAYTHYKRDREAALAQVRQVLFQAGLDGNVYAVRSSASIEDGSQYSYAGQFRSILNVSGLDAVVTAVEQIWKSAEEPGVLSYLEKLAPAQRELRMSVIIQEMVRPEISGVAFSKNPVSGMDEIVVEAVAGSGEALVQEGATPERWIYKWGNLIARPEEHYATEELILDVAGQVIKIKNAFRQDVDVEWVYDGKQVVFVQAREITALSSVTVYSNAIARDMLPGMICPLVWSVNVPMINTMWVRLLTEMIGPNDLDPLSLARQFYYRAYFNMTAFGQVFNRLGLPSESLEMMMGLGGVRGGKMPAMKPHIRMLAKTPRLAAFAWKLMNFQHMIETSLPGLEAEGNMFRAKSLVTLDAAELIVEIQRLYDLSQRLAYFNIVGPLLMYGYNGLLRQRLKQKGIDAEQLDLLHGLEELERYDPAGHLQRLNNQFRALSMANRELICAGGYTEFCRLPGIEEFQGAVAAFLERFGHLSDSGNDFSRVPWRENPDLILNVITSYPQIDQRPFAPSSFENLGSPFGGLGLTRLFYRRARQFRLYRERIGYLYTCVYGLFRSYFLALGDHLVKAGRLAAREDIFYLYREEAQAAALGEDQTGDMVKLAANRRLEMLAAEKVALPTIVYGDYAPPVSGLTGSRMVGTPTSRGVYTGPARVVHSVADFNKVRSGDVLVVPFSDVGWTPLFSRAGAVVAESGGILSHSSIIAREFGIPAVVSVIGALSIQDDLVVTVDGFKGEVLIHNNEPKRT